tara:strand:- start:5284 stop:6231 length:948 start_codon:yes stop_codon:yes gene_type:complete
MIRNFFKKNKKLKISLAATIIFILISFFFLPNFYKSTSIIAFSDDEMTSLDGLGIVGSLIGSNGSSASLFRLREYLLSEEGSRSFQSLVDQSNYQGNSINFFYRYRDKRSRTFNSYYKRNILEIKLLEESSAVRIETYGFSPKQAFTSNLAIILMSSQFIDEKQQLKSRISNIMNKCTLFITQGGVGQAPEIEIKIDNKKLDEFSSANDLLLYKASEYLRICNQYQYFDNNELEILPEAALRDINSESAKGIVSKIYSDTLKSMTLSDSFTIITEPQVELKPMSKNIFINAVVFFLATSLFQISISIISKLREDF